MTEIVTPTPEPRPPFAFFDGRSIPGLNRLLRRRSPSRGMSMDQLPAKTMETEVSDIFAEAEFRLEGNSSAVLSSANGSEPRMHLLDGKQLPQGNEWSGSKLVIVTDFHGETIDERRVATGAVVGFGDAGENRFLRTTYPLISGPRGTELGEQTTATGFLNNSQLRDLLGQIKGKDRTDHDQPTYNSFHPGPQPVFVLFR